jgi:hypothetical protein
MPLLLQVLYLFLRECAAFDWSAYCLTIRGRIPLLALTSWGGATAETPPTESAASVAQLLLPPELEERCLVVAREEQPGPAASPAPGGQGEAGAPPAGADAVDKEGHSTKPSTPVSGSTSTSAWPVRVLNIQDPLQARYCFLMATVTHFF